MKKWIPLLLSFMMASPVSAHYKAFTGFYGGLNLGLAQSRVQDDYNTILIWPQTFEINFTSDAKLTDVSPIEGVTLGYSALMNSKWVLGLEGRANFQDINTINNEGITEVNSMLNIEKHTSVEVDQDFALVAKLGFACHCKFLMYGLIGADWAKVNLSINALYEQDLGVLASATIHNTSSRYENGIMLGLGMEYYLTKCTTIGLEY